jgi:hypothetical protein
MNNMKTVTKRIASSYKHKRCKTKTTKIMNKRIANNCNQEGVGLKYFVPTLLVH